MVPVAEQKIRDLLEISLPWQLDKRINKTMGESGSIGKQFGQGKGRVYTLLDVGQWKRERKGERLSRATCIGKLNASAANSIDWFGPLTFSFDT